MKHGREETARNVYYRLILYPYAVLRDKDKLVKFDSNRYFNAAVNHSIINFVPRTLVHMQWMIVGCLVHSTADIFSILLSR